MEKIIWFNEFISQYRPKEEVELMGVCFGEIIREILPELRKEYKHWKPLYQNHTTTEEIFYDFPDYLQQKYEKQKTISKTQMRPRLV